VKIAMLGIDLAKNVFQIHGVDHRGKAVLKKRLRRDALLAYMANVPPCKVAMEACGGANYWSREFVKLGHSVVQISPQYVKPFVKTNKNDSNDAEAITEAASRPSMNFVSPKSIEQQDIQMIHRVRSRHIGQRTALVNQVRGLLAEYGIVVAQGIWKLRQHLPEILERQNCDLTELSKSLFSQLYVELTELDDKVKQMDVKLTAIYKSDPACRRLSTIPGLGVISATALVAGVGNVDAFKNGRQMSAWLGLVPRQYSSGDKNILLGM
jgi:transposase